jgi:hypothetical protein
LARSSHFNACPFSPSEAKLIDPDDNNARYNAACTYAQLGEIEQAVEMLEDWSKHCGAEQEMWFLHDSDLDPVRDHTRYPALVEGFKERGSAVASA